MFYFHPYLGTWSILTNIFYMGWNHQLVYIQTSHIKVPFSTFHMSKITVPRPPRGHVLMSSSRESWPPQHGPSETAEKKTRRSWRQFCLKLLGSNNGEWWNKRLKRFKSHERCVDFCHCIDLSFLFCGKAAVKWWNHPGKGGASVYISISTSTGQGLAFDLGFKIADHIYIYHILYIYMNLYDILYWHSDRLNKCRRFDEILERNFNMSSFGIRILFFQSVLYYVYP